MQGVNIRAYPTPPINALFIIFNVLTNFLGMWISFLFFMPSNILTLPIRVNSIPKICKSVFFSVIGMFSKLIPSIVYVVKAPMMKSSVFFVRVFFVFVVMVRVDR